MASFEPTIDYWWSRSRASPSRSSPAPMDVLSTAMKSVGETMAIGRTFKEALQKALRGLEIGRAGLLGDGKDPSEDSPELGREVLATKLKTPSSLRLFWVAQAMRVGFSDQEIFDLTWIDPWFLYNLRQLVDFQAELATKRPWGQLAPPLGGLDADFLRRAKEWGFSDRPKLTPPPTPPLRRQLAHAVGSDETQRAPPSPGTGGAPHLQAGGYLRRRVRGLHALLLQHLRERGRVPGGQPPEGHDPGRRAQPHRPGHRVRLLLRARLLRPQGDGHRVHHGQLQPRDRLHRLRHQRQALLRAPDPGGRAQHHR